LILSEASVQEGVEKVMSDASTRGKYEEKHEEERHFKDKFRGTRQARRDICDGIMAPSKISEIIPCLRAVLCRHIEMITLGRLVGKRVGDV
jgi:hypothetical protein